MKLLNLTSGYYFLFTFLIFISGSVISYKILKSIINKQFTERLYVEKDQFIYELNTFEGLQQSYYLNIGDKIEIVPIESNIQMDEQMIDTLMFDENAQKEISYRQLKFITKLEDKSYLITISKPLVPNEELVKAIGEIMFVLLAGLAIAVLAMNRIISRKIWNPFYSIMNHLKDFEIALPFKKINSDSIVDEFNNLSLAINAMTKRSQADYFNLKEFTENASHEIQTPLSIIIAKSEILLQTKNIDKKKLQEIKEIYEAAIRLSKLNHGLILMTKIENKQYVHNEVINITEIINKIFSNLSELIEIKNLKLSKRIMANPILILNPDLAYILFSNLINNAIKHNLDEGNLNIVVDERQFSISNSGPALDTEAKNLFFRFKKGKVSSDSIGLGLSLVKKICDLYQLKVTYLYRDSVHKVTVDF